jgi:hypothetical protein
LYFVVAKNNKSTLKTVPMSKILTKKIQTQLSHYFLRGTTLTKPETRCLKDMVFGVLKSKSVYVNQIAASLREPLKLKDVCKRLSAQYLKDDYADKICDHHLASVGPNISKDNFIVMDGTDISKKHAKYMEGLELVRNGDTKAIGLGYNVLNINAISSYNEITPLYSKAYSYQMGALSSNNEIKKAVRYVRQHIAEKSCWVFDRGADNTILKDFFVGECPQAIIRLKKNTKLFHKAQEYQVSQLVKKIDFSITQTVTKIKKDKPVLEHYELGAIPISYSIKGVAHPLWLVVSRNKKHGGLCYLLVKSELPTAMEVAKWAFKGYGLRWKIEEYHRHIKQEYKLEDIQMKTFDGLQSILATLTIAMFMIYKKIQSLHFSLLLDAGYNYLNKHTVRELTNFIYYKISKVVSILLMPTKSRWKILKTTPDENSSQLNLMFN